MDRWTEEEFLWLVRYSSIHDPVSLAKRNPPFEYAIFRACDEALARKKLACWLRVEVCIHSIELLLPDCLKRLSPGQARKARRLYNTREGKQRPALVLS